MTTITRLPSDLSRLGREFDMLDTIVTMMGDERFEASADNGLPRREVIARLAHSGVELSAAVWAALDSPRTAAQPGTHATGAGESPDEVRRRLRESQRVFLDAATHLEECSPDAVINCRGVDLRPRDVVPQRIADIVLANDAVSSVWTLDEADPDSVLDALDAMVRRLEICADVAPLTITTIEGDEWTVHGGGALVHGTREFVASWLARGADDEGSLPRVRRWG
ncbi:hypothetical protein GPOL_c24780 [Gordonia polyisoprenivorans VH2]|uniref:Mycothiol-dependent maleylpyruvate isomerase metal-binding domain-containing protein n=1 Tax=Gordonia polyisoprenivorans (strain DSM 44266 / VH2) TaxID=1112204 RepID=H6N3N6_GORPV|nr:hypothetical protein [Gordonia polyisoprenivorans]AFA73507.1 hypothetical protein GPOL_c24780 [Gordonia polyisoprenivorans VH2]QUD84994.1 hypothetical protein J8M97_10745 [Gordonia polyisoprenivorans]